MRKLILLSIASLSITAGAAVLSGAQPVPKPAARPGNPAEKASVRRWLSSLTLSQKVAQLIVIPFYGEAPNTRSRQYQRFVRLVRDQRVGGLVLINRTQGRGIQRAEPYALAAFLNRMQRMASIPLIVAGDFERGASMRVDGTTLFPHAMAFAAGGDPRDTRYCGEITARDSRALGVHWIFFPVADVNNNPDNPIINIRSYGENPGQVSDHVRAFIEGSRSDAASRVLTTAKHFPGHGDTTEDSHLAMPSIQSDRARLDSIELVPFRAAIAANVDSIMTAHIAVPAIDKADLPATLSPAITTTLLRDELKFYGLIVTDALEMGGVKGYSHGEAAVRALEAGADVLLMPPDAEAAIRSVVAAVRQGRLTAKRIDQSVVRVLEAKQNLGLDRARLVNLETIAEVINAPEAAVRAQEIADRAVTLVKNENAAVPLRNPKDTAFVILAESRYSVGGLALQRELAQRGAKAKTIALDPTMPDSELEAAVEMAAASSEVVVMAFASVSAYQGGLALPGNFPKMVDTLIAGGRPVTLVSLGSPYLVRSFPNVSGYLTTYSPVATAEVAAVKALFGEIDIGGRLPVTIPGIAGFGFGMVVPRRAQ